MNQRALAWIDDALEQLEQQGLLRQASIRSGPQGADINWNGRPLLNFGSNDYLGMAGELALAISAPGWGSGASPLITGRGAPQAELEEQLARFEQAEAALLFTSGYAANVGCLAALAGPDDVIFSDEHNHASIIDGCRLSGAKIVVYTHGDADALHKALRETSVKRRRLIVSDSLFSMGGDFAPLEALAELAEQHRAMLMIDEAHATGVFGSHGRGLCEYLGIEHAGGLVRIGTLSKALGSLGGFVAGSRSLIRWLGNRARPYFFSTAMPDAVAVAGLHALSIVRTEPQRRRILLDRANWLRGEVSARGWKLCPSQSQIIPLFMGEAERAMQAAAHLREQGLLVPGIRPPSVPQGMALLRISLSYAHTEEHCRRLLEALDETAAWLRRA